MTFSRIFMTQNTKFQTAIHKKRDWFELQYRSNWGEIQMHSELMDYGLTPLELHDAKTKKLFRFLYKENMVQFLSSLSRYQLVRVIGRHEDDYIVRCSQAIQAVEETAEGSQMQEQNAGFVQCHNVKVNKPKTPP